ncbi:MAG: hypothetical protein Q4E16_05870 [Neisseria sp.]|nr:hypothetical protein [Neisseria sp.]
MNRKHFLSLSTFCSVFLLASCASTGPNVAGNWQHLGNTHNGNIRNYIDQSSIKRAGQIATFRDRMVIQKTEQHRFQDTPVYKTAVGTWEIDCKNHTYRLTAIELLNAQGQVVAQHQYLRNTAALRIPAGSLSDKQYQIVCK